MVGPFSDRLRQRLCALRGRTDRGAGLETPRRCFRSVGSAARGRNFARPRFHGRPAKKGGSEGSCRKCERLHVRPGRVPGGVCAAARWPSVIGGAAGSDGGLRGETRRDSMIVLWGLCSGLFVGVRWLWDRCNTSGLFEPDPRRFSINIIRNQKNQNLYCGLAQRGEHRGSKVTDGYPGVTDVYRNGLLHMFLVVAARTHMYYSS